MSLTRRQFLWSAAASTAALGSSWPLVLRAQTLDGAASGVFRHGVASGDPLADRVILWTRPPPTVLYRVTGETTRIARHRTIRNHAHWLVNRGRTHIHPWALALGPNGPEAICLPVSISPDHGYPNLMEMRT